MTRLVDRSLVTVERDEPERYRLLETLRQYARDRLVKAGQAESVRKRHRDWYLHLAERTKPELIGPRQVFWLDRLESDVGNFRAALEWTLEHGSAELGLRLGGALWRFWFARDFLSEGRDWLSRILAAPGAEAPAVARAEALDGACELSFNLGDRVAILRLAAESLAIYRALGDCRGTAWALRQMAIPTLNGGDDTRAEGLATEALALAREANSPWVVAQILTVVGDIALARGDYRGARDVHHESLRLLRNLGDQRAIMTELYSLGVVALREGDYVAMRAFFEESLDISRDVRSSFRIGLSLAHLGGLARIEGDYARSQALLEESLDQARRSGSQALTSWALLNLGSLARSKGDVREGRDVGTGKRLGITRFSGYITNTRGILLLRHPGG